MRRGGVRKGERTEEVVRRGGKKLRWEWQVREKSWRGGWGGMGGGEREKSVAKKMLECARICRIINFFMA